MVKSSPPGRNFPRIVSCRGGPLRGTVVAPFRLVISWISRGGVNARFRSKTQCPDARKINISILASYMPWMACGARGHVFTPSTVLMLRSPELPRLLTGGCRLVTFSKNADGQRKSGASRDGCVVSCFERAAWLIPWCCFSIGEGSDPPLDSRMCIILRRAAGQATPRSDDNRSKLCTPAVPGSGKRTRPPQAPSLTPPRRARPMH